jgi:hypothetical protein
MDHPRPARASHVPVGPGRDRFTFERLTRSDGRHLEGTLDPTGEPEEGIRHAIEGSVVPLRDLDAEYAPKDFFGESLLVSHATSHPDTVARL